MQTQSHDRVCTFFILLFLAQVLNGCVSYTKTQMSTGHKLDENAINRIVLGQSTRSDVLNSLGPPHSIFRGQVEFREIFSQQVFGQFYLVDENRHLSAIDDDQYVMYYRFTRSSGSAVATSVFIVSRNETSIDINRDELLLILDRGTHIVQEAAYRKEL